MHRLDLALAIWLGLWALAALLVGCSGDRVTNSTTITITGPFAQCTSFNLPGGERVERGDVAVGRDGSVTIGGVTYTIQQDCSLRPVEVVPPVIPAPA